MSSSRAIRSAIGGWVENRRAMPAPRNGLAIISADAVWISGSGGSGAAAVPC